MGKRKLKDAEQVHGKEENFVPTTLEQIWGSTGVSKYGTLIEAEYINDIDGMNKSDLQKHAAKLGIMPLDNRIRLRETLLKEFRKHVASFRKPQLPPNKNNKVPSDKILNILSEGR